MDEEHRTSSDNAERKYRRIDSFTRDDARVQEFVRHPPAFHIPVEAKMPRIVKILRKLRISIYHLSPSYFAIILFPPSQGSTNGCSIFSFKISNLESMKSQPQRFLRPLQLDCLIIADGSATLQS